MRNQQESQVRAKLCIRADNQISSIFIILVLAVVLTGCGGGSGTQMAGGPTPTPDPAPSPSATPGPSASPTPIWTPSSPLPAPPAPEPPPPSGLSFPLTVSSPGNGATVNSPANVVASATPSNPILDMRVYVDGLAVFMTFLNSMDARIWMDPGVHTLEVTATDKTGAVSATILQVNVVAPQAAAVNDIQTLPGWESCSALFPPSAARAGQVCAAGLGNAVSTMIPGQTTPSLDNQATKFTMGGPTGYSNELYFKSLAGGTNVSHFIYDVWFLVDNPTVVQGLEFDVNQTFGGLRWTWGTECNFKGTGKWDIWDPLNEKWVPSSVACNPFPANTWIHLVWNFERVNGQVHYISVTVNGVTSNVDAFFEPQQKWTLEDINIAFQMDGDFRQDPYNVWLDKMTLQVF